MFGWEDRLGLSKCHGNGDDQFFAFSKSGEIITYVEEYCVGIKNQTVSAVSCSKDDKSQLWTYNDEVL